MGKAAGRTAEDGMDHWFPFLVVGTILPRLQLPPADYWQNPGDTENNFRPSADIGSGNINGINGILRSVWN